MTQAWIFFVYLLHLYVQLCTPIKYSMKILEISFTGVPMLLERCLEAFIVDHVYLTAQ